MNSELDFIQAAPVALCVHSECFPVFKRIYNSSGIDSGLQYIAWIHNQLIFSRAKSTGELIRFIKTNYPEQMELAL